MSVIRKPTPAEIQAERDQATRDYHDDLLGQRERTAKLRAQRLARDAGEKKSGKAETKTKPKKPSGKTK
jgi:hypothetical protein